MNPLSLLWSLISGSAGEKIGGAVSGVAQVAAVIAAVAPIALWLTKNKDQVFHVITYGELAFWGALGGGVAFVVVRLVHFARPPQ